MREGTNGRRALWGTALVAGALVLVLVGFGRLDAPAETAAASFAARPAAPAAPREAPVADAAMADDAETVRALIRAGADVNAAQGDGMTALHWAAMNGDAPLVEMLVAAGGSVRALTRNGSYTPLHMAARVGNAEAVRALLAGGADPVAATSSGGATPLHFAALSGSAETTRALLDGGAPVDVTERAQGQTPLIFAASANQMEVLAALLEAGADPAVTSKVVDIRALDRRREAEQRSRDRRMEALRTLSVEVGGTSTAPDAAEEPGEPAEPDPTEPLSYADLVGHQGGNTALLHAVREGHRDAVLALLEAGSDVNQVSAGDGTSPLLSAMINGHFDLGLELLSMGADPNLASEAGATPLYAALNAHWAPKSRYPQQHAYAQQNATYMDVMKTLLDAGADPNPRLTRHLWYMSFNFDLLQVDTKGATPFWRAAYATDVPAMKLLVSYGADPNIATARVPERRRRGGPPRDHSGLPPVPVDGPAVYPIHAASGVGYGEGFAANAHRHVPDGWVPAVRYLVEELGLDVNQRDLNGYTALHHAAARGDTELIEYLVSQGADVRVVSRSGQTTVDMANGPVQRTQPFPAAIALLESYGAINNHNCVSC